MSKTTAKPTNVDEYLSRVSSKSARDALSDLRAIIREEAPGAEEVISYGIPTFKCNGFLASFAAFKNHCSFFGGHTISDFAHELKGYKSLKGTIRFSPENPLPESLVRSVIRARLAENRSKGQA